MTKIQESLAMVYMNPYVLLQNCQFMLDTNGSNKAINKLNNVRSKVTKYTREPIITRLAVKKTKIVEVKSPVEFSTSTSIKELKNKIRSKTAVADELFFSKKYVESLDIYTEITSWCPQDVDLVYIYNQICECYIKLYKFKEVRRTAEKCLNLSPKCIRAHRHLLISYIKLGDLMQAEAAIKSIEKLKAPKKFITEEMDDINRLKSYLYQSAEAFSEQDYNKVLELVKKCCRISPFSEKFEIMKAEVSSALGNLDYRERVYADNAKFIFASLWKKFPVFTITSDSASGLRSFRTDFLEEWPTPGTGPHFDMSMNTNFTGIVGSTVHLVCRVKNLGNRTVSWVRHRDIHLLTVGRYTYTSDQRFEALHSPHTEEWTLSIRYAQKKDSGIYECQISTTPPIGHPVFLTVVEPETSINSAPDLYVNKGSTINLTCLVKYAPEPPPKMTWSHDDEEINFDSPRGGISLVTEKGPETTSRLMIQRAVPTDSGIYTCQPSNANPSSIRVHVVKEEHPAAMHHGEGGSGSESSSRVDVGSSGCTIVFVLLLTLL